MFIFLFSLFYCSHPVTIEIKKHQEKNQISWEGMAAYRSMDSSSTKYVFEIPDIDSIRTSDFKKYYKELNLRDTLVTVSGELSTTAEFVYKDIPVILSSDKVIFRIKRFDEQNKTLDTKYIKIDTYNDGC